MNAVRLTMAETEEEIIELAKHADDAKDRAYLLLLLRINNSIEANTTTTKLVADEIQQHVEEFSRHRVEFRKHVEDEAALFNQGRGAWKVTAIVLSVAQICGLSMAGWYVKKQDEDSATLRRLSEAAVQSQMRHELIDSRDKALADRIERIERGNP